MSTGEPVLQASLLIILQTVTYAAFLPPANEVCERYVFTGVCLSTGGHAWLRGEACVVAGGMCGFWGCAWLPGGCAWLLGVCMVVEGHAWLLGGVHGCRGACMVVGGCAWL